MRIPNLTSEEKEILKGYLKTSPIVLIRLKCHALLTRDKGMKVKDIADILSRSEKTISVWLKDWDNIRLASLFSGHENNENASRLRREQKEEIWNTVKNKMANTQYEDFEIMKKFFKKYTNNKILIINSDVLFCAGYKKDQIELINLGKRKDVMHVYKNFAILFNENLSTLDFNDGEVSEVMWFSFDEYQRQKEANLDQWCNNMKLNQYQKAKSVLNITV